MIMDKHTLQKANELDKKIRELNLTFEKIDHELKKRFGPAWRANDIVLSGGFP